MAEEIERKFLLEKLPYNLKHRRIDSIRQGYLAIGNNREVRIRQKGRHFFQTIKTGAGLQRKEIEIPLSRRQFEILWGGSEGFRLEKTRYLYSWEGYSLEVDQYHGILQGVYTAEVEFSAIKEAIEFSVPDFFREEVTFDPRYRNQSLAQIKKKRKDSLLFPGMQSTVIGSIPYFREENEKKVVLITNRKGSQWIFPKGQQEKNLAHHEVALLEAKEEAGIEGEITHPPIRIPYGKGQDFLNMLAFPMEVSKLEKSWQEERQRKRKVVSLPEAYKLSDQIAVHCGLKFLEQVVS